MCKLVTQSKTKIQSKEKQAPAYCFIEKKTCFNGKKILSCLFFFWMVVYFSRLSLKHTFYKLYVISVTFLKLGFVIHKVGL